MSVGGVIMRADGQKFIGKQYSWRFPFAHQYMSCPKTRESTRRGRLRRPCQYRRALCPSSNDPKITLATMRASWIVFTEMCSGGIDRPNDCNPGTRVGFPCVWRCYRGHCNAILHNFWPGTTLHSYGNIYTQVHRKSSGGGHL